MHPDPLLSAGLVAALREHGDFEVCLDGAGAMAEDAPPVDVVIADYANAMRLADEAVRSGYRSLATARVLALTSNDREADIRRAIEAGVRGYLLVGGPIGDLIEGVTLVARGMRYLCGSVAQRMADSLTRTALTSREIEVLQLVVSGESNKTIARQLSIELGTVKSHMSSIMTKLGASSRTQAAGIAAQRGLVDGSLRAQPPARLISIGPANEPLAQVA
jgi:two-component system NarL family response regulator